MGSNFNIFNDFLESKSIKKHEDCLITHTSLSKGKYFIDDNELDNFFKLYHNYIKDNNPPLRIVERPKALSCIKIDLDFRFSREIKNHLYTSKHIHDFIISCICEIDNYFNIDNDKKKVFVYEIEKPVTEVKKNGEVYKDGIHIMFPYIISKPNIQHIIRSNILKNFHDIFPIDEIGYTNSSDNIYDKSIIDSTGWLMYGSCKPNRVPYTLTHVYHKKKSEELVIIDDDMEIELEEEDISNYDLNEIISLSSIRNKTEVSEIDKNRLDEIEEFDYNKNKKSISSNKAIGTNYKKKCNEPISVKKFVEMLSDERADDYNQWLEIGLALYAIGEGDDVYYDIWDDFSKKSSKWEEGCCFKKWNSFNLRSDTNILDIGSLRYWAQLDNPIDYINYTYKTANIKEKIKKCLEEAHDYDISNVVNLLFQNEFCYEAVNQDWYQFINHSWKNQKREPLGLMRYLSEIVVELFHKYLTDTQFTTIHTTESTDERKTLMDQFTKIFKIIKKKLKDNKPKKSIIEESKYGFIKNKFLEKLDQNKDLVGFENGVYDLQNKQFRNGRYQDYISLTTGYNYIEYNKHCPVIKNIKKFFKSIQPDISDLDKQRRKYLKMFLSSCIQGVNTDETLHVFKGIGRNGKSKLVELMQKALGEYAGTMSISYLVKGRGKSSDASPDLVNVKNQRFVVMGEPSDTDRLHNGTLKEITGGDKMTGRGLYKDQTTFKPQYKLLIVCNDVPKLQTGNDHATYERLRIVNFPMKYSKNKKLCDGSDPYTQAIDLSISEKIEEWGPYFMGMLIHWFNKYHTNCSVKLEVPDAIINDGNEYRQMNDPLNDFFINQVKLEQTNKHNFNIHQDLWPDVKEWIKGNDIKIKYDFEGFKTYFLKKYKIPRKSHHIIEGWNLTSS